MLKWLKLVGWGVLIALIILLGVFLIQYFFPRQISRLVIKILTTSILLLGRLMVLTFIIGGLLMAILIHWVGWETVKFKINQMRYRSALMAKDYYKEVKKVCYGDFVVPSKSPQAQKLVLDGPDADVALSGKAGGKEHPGSEITYIDGKINGIMRTYHRNGNLESEISYRDGQQHGFCRTYYPDGHMHNEKYFVDGKMNGAFKAWDQDGSLFFEIHYKDNKQHGPDKSYHRNGMLEYEDIYVNGKRTVRKTYDQTGKLKFVQNYQ